MRKRLDVYKNDTAPLVDYYRQRGLVKTVDGMEPGVKQAVDDAVRKLADLGAELVDVSLPHTEYALATYYITAPAEASANLARFDGVRYGRRAPEYTDLGSMYTRTRHDGFGPEVKRRIMLGTYALSAGYYDAYYGRAQAVRAKLRHDFARAFERFDFLITPTTPEPPFRIGEKVDDPLAMYLSDIFTAPANLVGIPAIAVPSGFDSAGLPLSLQIMGRHFAERAIFRAAAFFEGETQYWKARPRIRT